MGGEVEGRVVLWAGWHEGRVGEAHQSVWRGVWEPGKGGGAKRCKRRCPESRVVREEVMMAGLRGPRRRGSGLGCVVELGVVVVEGVPLLLALGGVVVVLVVRDVVGVTRGQLGQCGGREGVQQRLDSSQHVPAAAQQHSLQDLNFAPREEPHQGLHAG